MPSEPDADCESSGIEDEEGDDRSELGEDTGGASEDPLDERKDEDGGALLEPELGLELEPELPESSEAGEGALT